MQHDYVIDNQSAPTARADINAALQAIATTNSGGTAPVTTYANQIWYDTAANQLKKRNEADSAWIVLGTVDETGGTFTPNSLLTTDGIAPATLVTSAEGIASNNNNTTIPTSAAVAAYTGTSMSMVAPATAGDGYNMRWLNGSTAYRANDVTAYTDWTDPLLNPIRCSALNYGTYRLRFAHQNLGTVSTAWARVLVEGTVVAEWAAAGAFFVDRVVDFYVALPGYRIVVQVHKDPAYPTSGGSLIYNTRILSNNVTIGVA